MRIGGVGMLEVLEVLWGLVSMVFSVLTIACDWVTCVTSLLFDRVKLLCDDCSLVTGLSLLDLSWCFPGEFNISKSLTIVSNWDCLDLQYIESFAILFGGLCKCEPIIELELVFNGEADVTWTCAILVHVEGEKSIQEMWVVSNSGEESKVIVSPEQVCLDVICRWTEERVSSNFCSIVNDFTLSCLLDSAIIAGKSELSFSISLGILPL